ncbi:MAG TPA: hypothetical protein VFA98_00235 [Thermoanaerobaculia bacterium]|jgi:hypothetical protein|nr:hypothetical protein [Thermoanaerobaculia bacterium]
MPAPTFKEAHPWTGTKRAFIASMPNSMPNEIVEAGKACGLKLTLAHVYAVRSLERRLKKGAKRPKAKAKVAASASPKPAARSRRVRRARPSGHPSASTRHKPKTAGRAASGRRGQRDQGFGGLMLGLVAIGGHHFAKEVIARLEAAVGDGIDDPTIEAVLKACGALLGLPRAIKVLEEEGQRAKREILEALQ